MAPTRPYGHGARRTARGARRVCARLPTRRRACACLLTARARHVLAHRYAFVNKLMQRQVANIMLQRERDNISEHMAELQRATAAHRKKEADEALLAEQNKLEVVKVALGSHGAHSKARSKRMSLASRVASRSASSKRSAAAELVGGGAGDTSTVREATRVPTPKSKARSIRNRFRFGKSSKSSAETVAVVQVDLQSADPSAAQHE